MPSAVVDRLFEDFGALDSFLSGVEQPSFRAVVDAEFRKNLLLAAASHFERAILETIEAFIRERAADDARVMAFVTVKAISRQYHTFFQWENRHINQFAGLFGQDFKEFMKREIERDALLKTAVESFLEIGEDRNRLVHQDFASYSLEKTAREIFDLYVNGCRFVEALPALLRT